MHIVVEQRLTVESGEVDLTVLRLHDLLHLGPVDVVVVGPEPPAPAYRPRSAGGESELSI